MRRLLAKDGRVLIEFRNELFAAFTLNKYSMQFYLEKLIDLARLPKEIATEVQQFYKERLLPQVQSHKEEGKIAYNDTLAKFHNPLTIAGDLFEPAGFKVEKMLFYHYHALPPVFEEKYPDLFRKQSLLMENPYDWRGYLMCSAYVVEAKVHGEKR